MIKIPIKGGLGNQMFGYAFYKYVLSHGVDARLSWREFIITVHHNGIELPYVFRNININLPWWCSAFISMNPFIVKREWIRKIFRFLFRICDIKYIRYQQKSTNSFDEIDFNKDSVLLGFWQNSKYIDPIRESILKDFIINEDQLPDDAVLRLIKKSNSVALHVRRGDYLNPVFADWLVIKNENYYYHAIDVVKNRVPNPIFFIFSDDLDWCRKKFNGEEFVFVDGHIGKDSYIDMYLMSQCKHNIISNSTFSWWGAYLNNNDSKIVIAPEIWTNSGIQSMEFCPNNWCFLPVF